MKVIDLLNMIAKGEVPKKIKVDNKFTYVHDGIDYKSVDGRYLFDSYLKTTTEDMNIEIEIIEDNIQQWGKLAIEGIKKCNEVSDLKIYIKTMVQVQNEIIDKVNGENNDN